MMALAWMEKQKQSGWRAGEKLEQAIVCNRDQAWRGVLEGGMVTCLGWG